MVKSVSLGLSIRVLVNLESLNMAESIGNITRHRKAPIIVKLDNGGYKLIYAPVVSGMSLAHHYQRHLARAARDAGLPVTRMSLLGYFMKFADDKIIDNFYPEVAGEVKRYSKSKSPSALCDIEKILVGKCTVADIGGFLYTNGPVKRTSRFSFSYLAPALDSIASGAVAAYPQIHVRFTPTAEKKEQVPFNVDVAAALYTTTFILEVDGIARLEVCEALGSRETSLGREEQEKRFRAAVKALQAMMGNMWFGAKKSRTLPLWQVESAVVTAAKGLAPFVPSPGHSTGYIAETARRAEHQKNHGVLDEYTVVAYVSSMAGGEVEVPKGVEKAGSLEEAIGRAAEWIKNNYFS